MSQYIDYGIKAMTIEQAGKDAEKVSVLSAKAAAKLPLDSERKKKIRALILVTQDEDFLFPSTAFVVQKELGLAWDCMVYDINLGADGFLTALEVVAGLLVPYGKEAEALVIAGDNTCAVAAITGTLEGCVATFEHTSVETDWDIAYQSRWDKHRELKKDAYVRMIKEAVDKFPQSLPENEKLHVVIPQEVMDEDNILDSSVMIPKEIYIKMEEDNLSEMRFACLGCGAGGSVTRACITVKKE